jgi:hypothetical protein
MKMDGQLQQPFFSQFLEAQKDDDPRPKPEPKPTIGEQTKKYPSDADED